MKVVFAAKIRRALVLATRLDSKITTARLKDAVVLSVNKGARALTDASRKREVLFPLLLCSLYR